MEIKKRKKKNKRKNKKQKAKKTVEKGPLQITKVDNAIKIHVKLKLPHKK